MTAVRFPFSYARRVADFLCANHSTLCTNRAEPGQVRSFRLRRSWKVPPASAIEPVGQLPKLWDPATLAPPHNATKPAVSFARACRARAYVGGGATCP